MNSFLDEIFLITYTVWLVLQLLQNELLCFHKYSIEIQGYVTLLTMVSTKCFQIILQLTFDFMGWHNNIHQNWRKTNTDDTIL